MAGVGELTEVILYVKDMNKQVSYYRDGLGLKVRTPRDLTDYSNEMWVEFDAGQVTLSLQGGGMADLVGDYATKVVFKVRKIAEVREELLGRGVKLGAVRSPAEGVKVVDGSDPEGNKFSLVEHG